ncbi:hypothetical protein ABIE44_001693 [Marmoricola sp. OAE513]|uniref:hypothetical protein n=1 Tax=Marmoricola sp. OAE513 TaxID=2817894 RepID=UPI001AEADAA8
MNTFGRGVAASTLAVAVSLSVAPTGAVAASKGENGTAVASLAAGPTQKLKKCTAGNRVVTVAPTAAKKVGGQRYVVGASTRIKLCTTKKNVTTVYSWTQTAKVVATGRAKVTVSSGSTKKTVSGGVTTLTTPLTAKAKWLFISVKVTGTLLTKIDKVGKVTSQIVNVKKV